MGWQAYTIIGVLTASAAYWKRRPLIFWGMETCLWIGFLRYFVRKLRLWCGLTRMTAEKYHAVLRAIKPGHIIMGTDYRKPGHKYGTPGEMAHGALCVACNGLIEPNIAEMVDEGFQTVYLSEFCFHYDRVLVLRCTDFTKAYIEDVLIPECMAQTDAKYDHSFILGNQSHSCFELPHAADKKRKMKLKPRSFFGKNVLTADSYLEAPNVRVVVDTDNLPTVAQGA